MLELVATCDNCGVSTADPIGLKRKAEGYRVNFDTIGLSARDMAESGWLFTIVGSGPAAFCPQCRRIYDLAIKVPASRLASALSGEPSADRPEGD